MTAVTVMPRSVGTGALGWTPTNVPPSRTNARPSCWSTAPSSTASYDAGSASAVNSAPVERTNSSSLGRPSPVTAQPADLASATAYPPTAPPAPVTSRVRPAGSPSRSTACAAVRELSGTDAASTGSSPSGTTATASASSRTRSAWARLLADHGVVDAGDDVADGDRRDLVADLEHATGDVPAETEALAGVDGAAARVGGDEDVDRVHRGRDGLDEHLAGSGLQIVDLDDLRLVVAGEGVDGTHGMPPWMGWTGHGCQQYDRRVASQWEAGTLK